jgi:uncharacterized SAM-binding protein YcdF (DUF218 family)
MDGRVITLLLTVALPAVLMAVTTVYFSLNPIAILVLISIMIVGLLYLLSYRESFQPTADSSE